MIYPPKPGHLIWGCRLCPTLINFRLKIIKLVTEQDYGIRGVAKPSSNFPCARHLLAKSISGKGRGDGVKSPLYKPSNTESSEAKDEKRKALKFQKTQTFHLKRLKKLQRELALARAEIAYLNFFVVIVLHGVNWQCSGR